MGYYVNLRDMTKEQWLEENGKEVSLADAMAHPSVDSPSRIVCLVDNGDFSAAGIAYDRRELEAFTLPRDIRPKRFFDVSVEKLLPFCPILKTSD